MKLLPYILVLMVGIFFHFYNFSQASFFYADQGNDLLIARAILEDGHRPLVGPLLTAPGIFIPPTYYYLLAAFLAVGKTPLGTAAIFAMFNLITMVGLMVVAEKLVDRKTAIVTALLFSITVVVQEHGRYIWQPHPVLWLETGMLLCFILAREQKRVVWLILGTLCYVLAVSVYPSAFLLVFYVWYQVVRLYRLITRQSNWAALRFAFVVHLIIGGLVYAPFFAFEYMNGFPTYHALLSPSFDAPLSFKDAVIIYWRNLLAFGESATNQSYVFRYGSPSAVIGLFVGVLSMWSWLKKSGSIKKSAVDFVGLRWVIVGLLAVVFYRLEIFRWRLWYLLPYWLLVFGTVIRFGVSRRAVFRSLFVVSLAWLYLLGNGFCFYRWEVLHPLDLLNHYRQASRVIEVSMQKNGYDPQDVAVVVFTPDDEQTSWGAPPVLYFLHEDAAFPIDITKEGNNIETWTAVSSLKPIKYLVCSEYASVEKIQNRCISKFFELNATYVQERRWLLRNNTMIFLFRKQDEAIDKNNPV